MPKACFKCGQCCKGQIGPFIFPCDIAPISTRLKISPFEFLKLYCKKHILTTKFGELEIYTVMCNKNGCIFLENNLCKIYEFRPYQCVNSPFQFLGDYRYWKHMKCLTKNDFDSVETKSNDIAMFKQIIDVGYKPFERSE